MADQTIINSRKKQCSFGTCTRHSHYITRSEKTGKEIYFIPFPKPNKDKEKCLKWIQACGRTNFTEDCVTKCTYICSIHFMGENGPTQEFPDPIPVASSSVELIELHTEGLKESDSLENESEPAVDGLEIYSQGLDIEPEKECVVIKEEENVEEDPLGYDDNVRTLVNEGVITSSVTTVVVLQGHKDEPSNAKKSNNNSIEQHYMCEFCNVLFKSPIHLQTHLEECTLKLNAEHGNETSGNSHTGNIKLKSMCDLCYRVFGTNGRLQNHRKACVKNFYRCPVCPYETYSLLGRNRHERNHLDRFHDRNKNGLETMYGKKGRLLTASFKCGVCSLQFFDMEEFFAHRKTHQE